LIRHALGAPAHVRTRRISWKVSIASPAWNTSATTPSALKRVLLAETGRFADIYGALETGRKLEHASDHLLRVAISLRDQILGQVEAGG